MEINIGRPAIPQGVYQPVKRCPNCRSVYLSDDKCEACGRSLSFHIVGEPFSSKSLYGLKERFYDSLPAYVRFFPILENKKSPAAQSYRRHLNKRFNDLLQALTSELIVDTANRRYFFVELLELIDELLRYGESPHIMRSRIEDVLGFEGALITSDLLNYLDQSSLQIAAEKDRFWYQMFMDHRLFGFLKIENVLKFILVTTTTVVLAVMYYEIIRGQVGR